MILQSNFSSDRQLKVMNHALLTVNKSFTSNITCVLEINALKKTKRNVEYYSYTMEKKLSHIINDPLFNPGLLFSYKSCPHTPSDLGHFTQFAQLMDINMLRSIGCVRPLTLTTKKGTVICLRCMEKK